MEMAESLYHGIATPAIRSFVDTFHDLWGEKTKELLYAHTLGNDLVMSRELAVKIEEVRIKTLWVKAAVANGNTEVIAQVDNHVVDLIIQSEMRVQQMVNDGASVGEVLEVDSASDHSVAEQDVKGGGGCPGDVSADLVTKGDKKRNGAVSEKDNDKNAAKRPGKEKATNEKILRCVTCPLCKREGVDARIQYFSKKKRITCSKCKNYKEYKND